MRVGVASVVRRGVKLDVGRNDEKRAVDFAVSRSWKMELSREEPQKLRVDQRALKKELKGRSEMKKETERISSFALSEALDNKTLQLARPKT